LTPGRRNKRSLPYNVQNWLPTLLNFLSNCEISSLISRGFFSPVVKRLKQVSDYSPLKSVEVKNMWSFISTPLYTFMPITVAAQSKAWAVFARLNTGNVGSNPNHDIGVCLLLFCVCIVLCR
jgi:hypothetical protein